MEEFLSNLPPKIVLPTLDLFQKGKFADYCNFQNLEKSYLVR
jgi:hypothetical protein